jgi:hypothetical protein
MAAVGRKLISRVHPLGLSVELHEAAVEVRARVRHDLLHPLRRVEAGTHPKSHPEAA